MLKAIHAQEDRQEAQSKVKLVADKLRALRLPKAAETVAGGAHETLSYYHFPQEHWRRIRTNKPLERIMREIRRRTRVVGNFPDGESALMLSAARLPHYRNKVVFDALLEYGATERTQAGKEAKPADQSRIGQISTSPLKGATPSKEGRKDRDLKQMCERVLTLPVRKCTLMKLEYIL